MPSFSDHFACFRGFLVYGLFENCSGFRRRRLDSLERRAQDHRVVYKRGSKATKNRLIYEYGERHQGAPMLQTIRPDGVVEGSQSLIPKPGRIIKTFCFRQLLEDPARPPEDPWPFIWNTSDGGCAVLQAWAGNADKKFSETMIGMGEYETDSNWLDDSQETLKAARDFRTVLAKLFDVQEQDLPEVKYWHGGESRSNHPIFFGTGGQLQSFLRDPEVQRQLLIKEFDGHNLVVFVVSRNPWRCGTKTFTFFDDVNSQYVVYTHEGESKFTCVMTLEQFRQDGGAGEDFDISDLSPVRFTRCWPPTALVCGLLGQGSFGKVYLRRDKRGLVAVKEYACPNKHWLGFRERVMAELVKKRPHPCLVRIYDVYYNSKVPHLCIVMEACTNDLHDVLWHQKIKGSAVNLRTAKIWMGHIFLGLEHLHLRMDPSVLHRDLKPSNVLLDERKQAKLADFGTVRLGKEANKWKGTLSFRSLPPGTPGYIAPELLKASIGVEHEELRRALDYSHGVDIYSFGVVCWRLLTTDYVPGERTNTDSLDELLIDSRKLRDKVADTAPDRRTKQFILRLLDPNPDDRLNHQKIRRQEFFEDLRLPPFSRDDDGIQQCREWCDLRLAEL